MKGIYYIILSGMLISAFGCKKGPYPYISIQQVRKIDSMVHPQITNAAFIYQNNIYYVADFDKPPTQITNDGGYKRFVKLSHDHSKFAYQNAVGIIVVIDSKGNNITTLSQYNKVKSFDWSADDKTLYILNGSGMVYYGPAMSLPSITYPGIINGSTLNVLSASVSMTGDFAYVIHGYNFINGDKYELIIKPAKSTNVIEYDDPTDDVNTMDYVNFSTHNQDLVVGYRELGIQSTNLATIKMFTDLKAYPDHTYGPTSSTPVYKSDLNYLVEGAKITNTNSVCPTAQYLGLPPENVGSNVPTTKLLTQYTFNGSDMYTDWK